MNSLLTLICSESHASWPGGPDANSLCCKSFTWTVGQFVTSHKSASKGVESCKANKDCACACNHECVCATACLQPPADKPHQTKEKGGPISPQGGGMNSPFSLSCSAGHGVGCCMYGVGGGGGGRAGSGMAGVLTLSGEGCLGVLCSAVPDGGPHAVSLKHVESMLCRTHCCITTPQQCLLMPLMFCSNKRLQQLQQQQREQKKSRRQCDPSAEPLLGRCVPELPAPPATLRSLSTILPILDTKVWNQVTNACLTTAFCQGAFCQGPYCRGPDAAAVPGLSILSKGFHTKGGGFGKGRGEQGGSSSLGW